MNRPSAPKADIAFQLARIADPAVASPVLEPFSNIEGFQAFGAALMERRQADAEFAALPVHEQYAELGPPEGIVVQGDLQLEILLSAPYPQILYWFALEFSAPVPCRWSWGWRRTPATNRRCGSWPSSAWGAC